MSQPHPFPPVVRWMVYPALAGLAGALGGGLAVAWGSTEPAYRGAVIAGAMSVGAALGAMLSRRAWISLVAAPVLGLLLLCASVAFAQSIEGGRQRSAVDLLREIVRESRPLLAVLGGVWLQAAAAHVSLRPPRPPTLSRLAAVYGVAALASAVLGWSIVINDEMRGSIALLFAFLTAFQAPVVRLSAGLAARLRPSVAP